MNAPQSSLAAPAPVARLSCRVPPVSETLSGATTNERVMPEASTPSQLFAPWVIETRWTVAPTEAPPAADRGVELERRALGVRAEGAAAPVICPSSSEPVPVAVKSPER